MRTPLCVFLLASLAATTLVADVQIRQESTGTGLAAAGSGVQTMSIKGLRMRTEIEGQSEVTILDIEGQRMWVLDTKKNRGEVFDLRSVATAQQGFAPTAITSELTPADGTREIAGYAARKYSMRVTVRGAAPDGSTLTTIVAGPVWIAPDAPGAAEYANFFSTLAERGLFLQRPEVAQAQPGQAKSWTQMYRALAGAGMPLASDIGLSFQGEGMMAAIFERMGSMTVSSTATSVSTAELPGSLFEPPAGWKIKERSVD